jgi:hypothetical protein
MPAGRPQHPNRRTVRLVGDRFYDGAPCALGHTRRYTSTAQCVVCARYYDAKRRKKA